MLVIQSLPFVAAVGLALIERTRLNDFGYWRSLDARFAELLGRRAPIAQAVSNAMTPQPAVQTVPVVAPVSEQVELVQ